MRRAVFLDRDGVLNEADSPGREGASPRSLDGFRLIDAAVRGTQRLHTAGFALVVVTNQPDIGRGLMHIDDLIAMHDRLSQAMPIELIRVCLHGGSEECSCRKPAPGMLLDAAADMDIDLSASWMVGDRWVDVVAGSAAGTRTILIERPYSMLSTSSGPPPAHLTATATARDLDQAADIILGFSTPVES